MKCPNCDQEVEASATFCGNCGHQMQAAEQADQSAASAEAEGATPVATQAVAPVQPDATVPQAPAPVAPAAPVPQNVSAGTSQVPNEAPVAPAVPGTPAYAVGQAPSKAGKRLTLAVVLAVLSVPGAIIPFVGFGLAIAAIIVGAQNRQASNSKMIVAMVFAAIGIVFAALAFNYNLNEYNKRKQSSFGASAPFSASVSVVNK